MSYQKHTKAFGNLQVVNSLLYHKAYKDVPSLAEKIDLLSRIIPFLRKKLKVSRNLQVVMRPIRGDDMLGQFCEDDIIEIDPRTESIYECVQVLCHEFVHAEQHHLGKLTWGDDGQFLWKKKKIEADYWHQPWEKEAHERDQILASMVCIHFRIDREK
jgi:hypothetical protein